VAQALEQAGQRGFRPIPLNAELRGTLQAKVRPIETRNVIAKIEGTDKKDEAVIFSAHYDHLGVGQPANGDAIYNGAADNATGCALIVEVARAWAALPNKPRRTALFLAVTGEESGLRGSEYYAQNPVFPPKKTALGLNFDMFLPFGRTRSIVAIGSERTTAYPLLEEVVRRFGKEIVPDPRPEAGSYYRSDHFSFAKIGIPAFSVGMGNQLLSKPGEAGAQMVREWLAKNYHQPSDEYRDDWDFSGIEEMTRFGFTLGLNAANAEKLFTWKPGDEFLAARER
jgi:Zn-dependent M28 family amino/carboxypeptidase